LLAAGAKAVLSGPSAARLHGMEVTADFACVTVPAERHLALPGVRLLREAAGPPDCTTIDDLPATTRPRTVFDRLRVLPRREAATLLDRALQQQWITKDDLIERVAARRRHRDVPRLRELVDGVRLGARSAAERLLIEEVRAAGLTGWAANYPVRVGSVVIAVADLAFPRLKLAIEVDGRAWHTSAERFQLDRTRQNRLVNAGWLVLRFTWDDLANRPRYVIATLRAALAQRAS
jgi:very-short-patch-repair endonuclease